MEQKLISEFRKLGCNSAKQNVITYQVYLELCEVKNMHDINYFYNSCLNTMYLTAKNSKTSPDTIFVPVPATEKLSFNQMQNFLTIDTSEEKSIVMVFVASDSTCVYYKIKDGLIEHHENIPETHEVIQNV